MSASAEAAVRGVGRGSVPSGVRADALARFEELPARVSIRGGRGWKHDLDKLDLSGITPYADGDADGTTLPAFTMPSATGVTIERFSLARERHRAAFERAFGTAVDTRDDKFASLALAFAHDGVFIDVPAGVALEEPLEIG